MARINIDDVPAASKVGSESPWLAEQLRLTAFPASRSAGVSLARDWWAQTAGQPPESVQEEPRKGSIQLQGKHDDGQLIMSATAERLDIRMLFRSSPDSPTSIPEYSKARGPFLKLASRWLQLEARPSIQRLAFGAVVTNTRSTDLEDCRDVLDRHLDAVDMKKTELRDFAYQVNRRRSSETVDGVEINRIAKWGISTVQDVALTSAGIPLAQRITFSPRLELDINSDPQAALRQNRLVQLLEEFTSLADQIIEYGDRP